MKMVLARKKMIILEILRERNLTNLMSAIETINEL